MGRARHRLGTVRRPSRGVPKEEFTSRDLDDMWLAELAPSGARRPGCYREDESRWRRSVLRELFVDADADLQ